MSDKSFWTKLIENSSLVLILIGVVVFIIGASGKISLGASSTSTSIPVGETTWRIALGIMGGIFALTGLLIYVGEKFGFVKSKKVKAFRDVQEFLKYVIEKLEKAQKGIDDLSWISTIGKSDDLEPIEQESKKYHEMIKQTARRIPYREVFIFNRRDRTRKAYSLLADNANGYSCGYYEPITNPPLLSFMVIDENEVLILNSNDNSPCLAIQQPEVVEMFVKYYDDIWKRANKMKQGKDIFWDSIEKALGKENADSLRLAQAKQ